jgi:hypothetical protein
MMEEEEMEAAVKKFLVDKGVHGAGGMRVREATIVDGQDEAGVSFFVADEVRKNPPKDWTGHSYFVAVDADSGKIYYKDKKGFELLVRKLDYPKHPDRISADDLVSAWVSLLDGRQRGVVRAPSGSTPEALRALISKPATRTEADGSLVTIGWTEQDRGKTVIRHTITVHPNGKADGASVNGRELVPEEK